jgi:hypothetical protein
MVDQGERIGVRDAPLAFIPSLYQCTHALLRKRPHGDALHVRRATPHTHPSYALPGVDGDLLIRHTLVVMCKARLGGGRGRKCTIMVEVSGTW